MTELWIWRLIIFPEPIGRNIGGAIGSAVLVALILWGRTYGADPYVIYAVGALFLFMICNLFVTRLVLHVDRIESINLLGRRSLSRDDIARLEIREATVKGKTVKSYFLISKREGESPLMVPGNVKMDATWLNWMAPIPEETIPPIDRSEGAGTGMVVVAGLAFVAMLIVPIIHSQWKPYFDLLHLFLPWVICLYIFTSDRMRSAELQGDGSGKSLAMIWLMMGLSISPIYLIIAGRLNGVFVVGGDSWLLIAASAAMAVISLVLARYSPFDSLNMKRDWLVTVVALAGFYGYGAAQTANELFDVTSPETVNVAIASKYVVTGKGAGSFFKLAPWGAETMQRSYRPTLATYNSRRIGDSVCAELHAGAIGMRWYQLSDSCPRDAK